MDMRLVQPDARHHGDPDRRAVFAGAGRGGRQSEAYIERGVAQSRRRTDAEVLGVTARGEGAEHERLNRETRDARRRSAHAFRVRLGSPSRDFGQHPLGALRPFTAIATTLFPGVTTITSRVRYLSWVCAGLRLLDEVASAPSGGRAGRARRQRILAWERLVALATGSYARAEGVAEDNPSWNQLRGVSYVLRAVAEDVRSPAFTMLRNQVGVGGVGTYWVTLVAGGLVEDDAGRLTPRGTKLADIFLSHRATPDRADLVRSSVARASCSPSPC